VTSNGSEGVGQRCAYAGDVWTGSRGLRSEPIFRGCLQSACRESEPLPAWRRRSLLFLECEEETLVSEI